MTKTVSFSFAKYRQDRIKNDIECRISCLNEAAKSFFSGDRQATKYFLQDYILGTIGMKKLSELLGKSEQSLMRMLGSEGNPTLRNITSILTVLQRETGMQVGTQVHSHPQDTKQAMVHLINGFALKRFTIKPAKHQYTENINCSKSARHGDRPSKPESANSQYNI